MEALIISGKPTAMTKRMPKLSVIVPIWGVEKYIEKCARSLFESTLDDMEFIFVDDCSPDKAVEIIQRVIEEYPNRKEQTIIVRHEINKGLPQARKTGIEACSGEFIAHCDSDDWVDFNMYEKMLATAVYGGYDLVCCGFVYLSDKKELWKPVYDSSKSSEQLRMDLISCKVSNAVWNKIVHRSIYARNEIYFPTLFMDEDDVLTCQLAYYSKKPGYIHECLYFHYANPASMTHENNKEKIQIRLKERISNRRWIITFLESKEEKILSEAINNYKISVKIANTKLTNRHSRKIYPECNGYMISSSDFSKAARVKNFIFLYLYPMYPQLRKLIHFIKRIYAPH